MNAYLIIDDEPLIRTGLAKLISRISPNWTMCGEADSGLDGLEMIIRLKPDLVFTDIRMPDMDGLTMNRILIEQAISVPIVFFTGHDEFSYIQQAIRQNAFDYLLKPVQESEMRRLFTRYEQEFGEKKMFPGGKSRKSRNTKLFFPAPSKRGMKTGCLSCAIGTKS